MSKFKFRFGSLIVIINVYILGHILVYCQSLNFRPHVKDNSRRVFLQKKKKAIFDGEGWQCWWWYCDDNRDNDGDNVGLIFKGLYKQESDNSYNAFEKDIAVVHFFFQVVIIWLIFIRMMVMVMHTCFIIVKVWSMIIDHYCQEPTVFQFRRALRMTWVDFISQMGGEKTKRRQNRTKRQK